MKKFYILIALLAFSGAVFAQMQRVDHKKLSSIKVSKEINTLHATHAKAVFDSLHYDGAYNAGTGTGGAADFGVYAFFPAALMSLYNANGNTITSVKVYINGVSDVAATELRFYSDTLATALLYTQAFTPVEGWNDVTLTTPFSIPATNLYIGYNLITTGGYPAGCDDGPVNSNGNWIHMGSWTHLTNILSSLTFNWHIRAMVDGAVLTAPYATCSPLSWNAGSIKVSSSSTTPGHFTLTNIAGGTLTCSGITGLSAPLLTSLIPSTVSLTTGQSKTFNFNYCPTVVGNNNQTVVIATNGGDVTINLTGTAINCPVFSSYPWTDSFENNGIMFPPDCWSVVSPDSGSGYNQIAVGTTPIPGFTGGTVTAPIGGGNKIAYSSHTTGGAISNNQWLITPQFTITANQDLIFYLYWFGHFQDKLDIKVSTNSSNIADFTTTLLSLDSNSFVQGVWTQYTVHLSAYASQNIFLAFNEHIADNQVDGAFIGIDLVKIDATTGISEAKDETVSVFPNPANDRLYIVANNIKSVEIYNIVGENVTSYGNMNVINISDLAIGTYVVKIVTDSKVITKKINIAR